MFKTHKQHKSLERLDKVGFFGMNFNAMNERAFKHGEEKVKKYK